MHTDVKHLELELCLSAIAENYTVSAVIEC